MRTHGSTIPFRSRPWPEISGFLTEMAARHPQFAHMAAIADSVRSSAAAGQLAATTSMHDILVVTAPPPDPPYDLIRVCAPGSLREPLPGHVIIEHHSCTGHNDRIERPATDAVRLFWRFIITKYGIHPGPPPHPSQDPVPKSHDDPPRHPAQRAPADYAWGLQPLRVGRSSPHNRTMDNCSRACAATGP